MSEKKKISFVIPCYGSEKTIEYVIHEIEKTMDLRKEYVYEVVAVNDSSPDKVWDVLSGIAEKDKNVKLINLSKNMNRPGAVMAGLNNASGDYVCVMDDDGQCPMDRFFDLLKPLEEGYDVSLADYPERKQSAFKNFGTFMNKKMTEYMLDRPKDLQFTNFMIMKSYIVKEICKYKNPYPYMTGLVLRTTRNICCVPMEERERYTGSTNFTFAKMLSLWMNGLTAFSIKPLRLASMLGFLIAFSGFIYGVFIIFKRIFMDNIAQGYSSIMAIILFIGGIIMILLGLIGEYLGRIYMCINESPQFVIKEKVNFEEE